MTTALLRNKPPSSASPLAGERSHIDDPSPAGTPHQRQNLMSDFERAQQVHLHDALPFRRVELLERLITSKIRCIVHKNVDVLAVQERERLRDVITLGHVNSNGTRAAKLHWVDIPNPDICSVRCKLPRNRSADTACAAVTIAVWFLKSYVTGMAAPSFRTAQSP
jgi:hypothetical protein